MNEEMEPKLERLREDMRLVTADIIKLVEKRMKIASQIGNIKKNLMMNIEDISVEQDMARYVHEMGTQIGLNNEFIGRLLNLLFLESIRIQKQKTSEKETKLDHMAMFLKAKQLESEGKKIIHLEVGEPDYMPPSGLTKLQGTSASSLLIKSRRFFINFALLVTLLFRAAIAAYCIGSATLVIAIA